MPSRRSPLLTVGPLDGSWTLVAMHDAATRRGLWMRVQRANVPPPLAKAILKVELRSGREGDDNYVELSFNQMSQAKLHALVDLLDTVAWTLEMWCEESAHEDLKANVDKLTELIEVYPRPQAG